MGNQKRGGSPESRGTIGSETPTKEIPMLERPEGGELAIPQSTRATEILDTETYIKARSARAIAIANRALNKLSKLFPHTEVANNAERASFNQLLTYAQTVPNKDFPRQLDLCIQILENHLRVKLPEKMYALFENALKILREDIRPKL